MTAHETPRPGLTSDDHDRAEEIADEAESRGEDRDTIREAMEQELQQEGLSDEGDTIGQHID
jgi:hypothetical protein